MVEGGRGNTATSKGIYLNLKKFEGQILVDGEGGRGNIVSSGSYVCLSMCTSVRVS